MLISGILLSLGHICPDDDSFSAVVTSIALSDVGPFDDPFSAVVTFTTLGDVGPLDDSFSAVVAASLFVCEGSSCGAGEEEEEGGRELHCKG